MAVLCILLPNLLLTAPLEGKSQRTLPGSKQPLVVSGSHVIAQSCVLSAAVSDSALGVAGKALMRPCAAAWAVLQGQEEGFLRLCSRTEGCQSRL